MSRNHEAIANAAVALVEARRAKIKAKAARNHATNRGHPWPQCPADGADPPCWQPYYGAEGERDRNGELPEDQWCEHCRESKRQHEEYLRQARRTGALLRKLERLVFP